MRVGHDKLTERRCSRVLRTPASRHPEAAAPHSSDPVSVHDFHATMLHLLGVDAAKLAVKYQGLDVRLTGAEGGRVVEDIIA
jgi:arylsulfatase A-like enzyme